MEKIYHPYHIVNISPWPLFIGIGVMIFVLGMINMFVMMEYSLLVLGMISIVMIVMLWWRDVIRESTYQGYHTSFVLNGVMIGMILFILSEIFFFLSFFWAFFHSSLNSTLELGMQWPPMGVEVMSPFQVPLLNTVILLSSGISVTWTHQSILNKNWLEVKNSLMITWILGIYFLLLQLFEYKMAMFSMMDSVYGSVFFMSTGFHGFHVIVGTIFLFIMWMRVNMNHFSNNHHFGFEAAAWYWHFVDVVWLFLFSVVYWWGM